MEMNFASGISVGIITMVCVYLTKADEDTSSYLNKSCERWNDCGEFGYYCDVNMTCQCTALYITDMARKKCIGGIGQKCTYDDDCIEKAFCEKQTMCKCKKKYHSSDDGFVCVRNSSKNWKWDYSNVMKFLAILIIVKKIS